MRMRAFLISFLSLSTRLITGVAAAGDCDLGGPWGEPWFIGDARDEDKFDIDICETRWKSGRVIKGVEVWATKKNIAGIQLTYSDNVESGVIGSKNGDRHGKLEWDPAVDRVQDLLLWSNPQATRLGKIYMKLTNGETLDISIEKPAETIHYMEVYSGIILAGYGRADSAISAWGFMFLESEVDKISINDFRFDDDLETFVSQRKGIKSVLYASKTDYSTTQNATTLAIKKWVDVSDSYSYSQAVHGTFGGHYDVEISGQVAGLGPKVTSGFSWEVGQETTKKWENKEERKLNFETSQDSVPGYTTTCVGYAEHGTFDGWYDANVNITLKSGVKFSFRERGQRNAVFYGSEITRCADEKGYHADDDPMEFIQRNQKHERDLGKFVRKTFTA